MKNNSLKRINVLFLGGGERVSFARHLVSAGAEMGLDVKIYSYELTYNSPISTVGTVILGLEWGDAGLIPHIHEMVKEHDISLLIPFMDAAVVAIGKYLTIHGGVWAPVMNTSLAVSLYDKILSADLFEEYNLPIPLTYKGGRPKFPLIAKPRYGVASKGIEVVNDVATFRRVLKEGNDYLMQQYFPDIEEFTVDCYITQKGHVVCVSPRKRLEVSGGEVSKSVTVDDADVLAEANKTLARLRLRGAVTLQFLRDLTSGRLYLMEIDPCVAGGVVCSIHAGANIARFILEESQGLTPALDGDIKPGTLICRYFEEAVFQVNQ